ncbi:hypothetical protein ACQBAR_15445 [Propionibacteriaceae bacterium Y1685]
MESSALVRSAGSRSAVGEVLLAPSAGSDAEGRTVSLPVGTRIGIEVDPTRWCLGHRATDGTTIRCPDDAVVVRGRQCARCEADDPWRWMHIVHRSQFPPAGALRDHIMRPHWLYVATFAEGVSKVGTAVDERKQSRLDEQGPMLAHWIALAPDGIHVREWEDLVSRTTSLGQVVTPAAKVAGLAAPVDLAAVERQHQRALTEAGEALGGVADVTVLAEPWPNPRDPASLPELVLRPYPGSLGSGRHGFTVHQCWGPVALVTLEGDQESTWAVDLTAMVGHRVRCVHAQTPVPQIQDGLF